MMSYRDFLALRGIEPLRIERTQKRGGHLVLRTNSRPAIVVPGRKGAFAGYRP